MLTPMMADSASGVSMTRCSPKSLSRPSVMRKPPPRVPTSSPSSTTRSSASMASRRAVFRALAIVICAIAASPSGLVLELGLELLQLPPLGDQGGRRVGVDVVDQVGQGRVGHLLDRVPHLGRDPVGLGLDLALEVVGPQAAPAQDTA